MALTNYRAYKWLIDLLDEAPDQRYGLSREQIDKAYKLDYYDIYNSDIQSDKKRQGITSVKKVFLKDHNEEVTLTYKTLINWRNAIWKEFGLIIWHPVIKKTVNRIINGIKKEVEEETTSNTYIILNKELLDENKTLRETLNHLAEDEKRGYVNESPFGSHVKGRPKSSTVKAATMGFITVGNGGEEYPDRQFGYVEESEMVDIIRFSMNLGEALVIRHGSKNMVLESQELKYINGRWYVAGKLYQLGNQDKARLVIYDVEKIQLYDGDDEVILPFYEIKEGFDMANILPNDWEEYFTPDQVVSVCLRVRGCFLENTPLCSTQIKIEEKVGHFVYRVYVKPDVDFFIQYMAYGNELLAFDPSPKYEKSPLDITPEQISYLIRLKNNKS